MKQQQINKFCSIKKTVCDGVVVIAGRLLLWARFVLWRISSIRLFCYHFDLLCCPHESPTHTCALAQETFVETVRARPRTHNRSISDDDYSYLSADNSLEKWGLINKRKRAYGFWTGKHFMYGLSVYWIFLCVDICWSSCSNIWRMNFVVWYWMLCSVCFPRSPGQGQNTIGSIELRASLSADNERSAYNENCSQSCSVSYFAFYVQQPNRIGALSTFYSHYNSEIDFIRLKSEQKVKFGAKVDFFCNSTNSIRLNEWNKQNYKYTYIFKCIHII